MMMLPLNASSFPILIEAELRTRRNELEKLQQKLEDDVDGYFRPLVEAACQAKDFALAQEVIDRIPDTVSKVFLMDTLRQARLNPNSK